jgi:peptidyl-prolyl cis-trans isomerase NIMA-interacting 1
MLGARVCFISTIALAACAATPAGQRPAPVTIPIELEPAAIEAPPLPPPDPQRVAARSRDVPESLDPEKERITASHIVVAWAGAMRARANVTRTKAEAFALIGEVHEQARAGADFGELAARYSDEPGAGERRGNLGDFSRRQMVKPFADAAFALEPGELSDIVETSFGYHLILRTQ